MSGAQGCNTHLTQKEELVCAFLGVIITGALHLLQVNPVQLELLQSEGTSETRGSVSLAFISYSATLSPVACVCVCMRMCRAERQNQVDARILHTGDSKRRIISENASKSNKRLKFRLQGAENGIIMLLKYSERFFFF